MSEPTPPQDRSVRERDENVWGEQARAERLAAAMLARDAFSRWLGVEIVDIRPGSCTTRMTVRADMLNGFDVAHGAITFAVADSAMAFASNGHGTVTLSVENSIRYPAAARVGDVLTAVAEEEAGSSRLRYFRATVSNAEGTTVALFRGTVYRTEKELTAE